MAALWSLLGLRVKRLEDSADRISSDHNKLEIRIAGEYVPRRDLEKLSDALFRKLDTIESLLHSKADK